IGADGDEMRRTGTRRVPLAPAIVRHTDHADPAVRPVEAGDLLDHVVDRFALGARHRIPGAFGTTRPRHIHSYIGLALVEGELDGAILDAGKISALRNVPNSIRI